MALRLGCRKRACPCCKYWKGQMHAMTGPLQSYGLGLCSLTAICHTLQNVLPNTSSALGTALTALGPFPPDQMYALNTSRLRTTRCYASQQTNPVDLRLASSAQSRRQLLGYGSALLAAQGASLVLPGQLLRSADAAPLVATAAPLLADPSIVQRFSIAPDLSISRVVKGCWQLSGGHKGDRASDRTGGSAAVEDFDKFFNAGITSFDCADHYGPAEVLIGRYLQSHPAAAAPKSQVLTKYCVFSGVDMATINSTAVEKAVDMSLKRLGLQQVAVMQFYWQDYDVKRYVDGMKGLAEAQAKGQVAHLGVTNFDTPRMEEFAKAGIKVATNQLQYSLLDTRPENGMAAFSATQGTYMLPYGVLAGGFLSQKYLGVPAEKVQYDTYSKGKYGRVIQARGGWAWFQELLQACDFIAKRHGVTISMVASRWVLDKPGVAGVILGARNAEHVGDMQRLFTFQMDDEDRSRLQEVLDRGVRPKGDCYGWERGTVW